MYNNQITVQNLLSDISIYYQHEIMRAAARRAALFIIARYGEGNLAIFPRDLIKLIANEVWETRLDDVWMDAGERGIEKEAETTMALESGSNNSNTAMVVGIVGGVAGLVVVAAIIVMAVVLKRCI